MIERVLVGFLGLLLGISVAAGAATAAAARDHHAEIAGLAERVAVRRAMDGIARIEAENVDRLLTLNEVAAPPFGEQNRAGQFARLLQAAGLSEVEIDGAGNVIGRWSGDGRVETLAVVAHLDTVFPAGTPLVARREQPDPDDAVRWYAPGIGDNTRGLILLLTLIESMREAEIRTERNILFVGSVGEEGLGDLRGVKHLLRAGGPRIDEFIAIDGSNDQRVLNRAIGSHRYRITIKGPGGHSWGAFGLANPSHALASVIHTFVAEASLLVADGPRTTYNIGRIGGGTSVNAVPHESWAEVDLRSEDPQRLAAIDDLLSQAAREAVAQHNEARTRGGELTVAMDMIGDRPSGQVDPSVVLIQRALAATRYLGLTPQLGAGSTDANVPIALGMPATTISRGGRSGAAHSLGEWWSNESVEIGSQRALLLVLASAGLRPGDQAPPGTL